MTFEQWLQANGFDSLTLGDKQIAKLRAVYQAETAPPPPVATAVPAPQPPPKPATPFGDKLQAIEAEAERQQQIGDLTEDAAKRHVYDPVKVKQIRELGEAAIADEKTDVRAFQLSLLRVAERYGGPMVITPRQQQLTGDVVEAAVCKAGGLKTLERDFSPATLEAADKRFRGGIGLQEVIGLAAQQNGYRGGNVGRDLREALRCAFTGSPSAPLAVGPSTLDISGILSNIANKFVREAFTFVEDTWKRIAATRSMSDFKTVTTYSLSGDLTYDAVPPGGEIKHGTLGEETYTNSVSTFGKLLGIDRRDLINDDLNALSQASRRLGRGAALKLCDVFWTEFLADASTFYTAARGNYDDGASDTLLDLTGVANAHTLFTTQTDPDGKPMGTQPAIVLVPPQLWAQGWTLFMSTDLNLATSTAASTGTRSPWTGMFRLEMSRYLANSAYTGYSTKAWYMLADPNDLPVIEVGFLNGQMEPTIETSEMDFNRLGIALRGFHDFGVKKQEYRAAVKLKGEA